MVDKTNKVAGKVVVLGKRARDEPLDEASIKAASKEEEPALTGDFKEDSSLYMIKH